MPRLLHRLWPIPPYAVVLLAGYRPERRLQELVLSAEVAICADGAAKLAIARQLPITAVVGDFDSLDPVLVNVCRHRGVAIVEISEPEHNDFEKALHYLAQTYTGPVAILGMTGLREDHALSNFSVMLRWSDRFQALIAYDSFGSYRFLTSERREWTSELPPGQQVSLIPFGTAIGVTTTNLKYPLSHDDLTLGVREGLSNVVTGQPASVTIESGALLIVTP